MPVPSAPSRAYSFTDYSISNPSGQQPGNKIDAEYDRTNTAVSDLITFVRGIIADDGTLKPGTVGEAQLQSGILGDLGQEAAGQAAASATSAASSATAAGQYANAAQTSANTAAATASTVAGQVQNAQNYAAAALTSRNEALGFRNDASASALNALNSANSSAGSAAAALNSQTLAQRWASDLTGPVGGGLYSAYYYALAAGWRPGGTGAAGTAQGTTFLPNGNITATNVQFALQQLDALTAKLSGIDASVINSGTLAAARIPGLDASKIVSGTIDPARIPGIPTTSQVFAAGDTIAGLTAGEQAAVTQGCVVILTGGRRWMYTGTGSKTSESSYILISDLSPDWSEVVNKPSTFPATAHTHTAADITSGVFDLARIPLSIPRQWTIAGNGGTVYSISGADVQNDLAYLVTVGGVSQTPSTHFTVNATADTITFDEAIAVGQTINVRQIAGLGGIIAKGDIGLGNVDNTSDANKPISTATQTALDTKLARNLNNVSWPAVVSRGTFSTDLSGRFPYDFFGTLRINTGVDSPSGGNHGNALFCHENSLNAGIISYPAAMAALGINKQPGGAIWASYFEAHTFENGGAVAIEAAGYRRTTTNAEQSPIHSTAWNPPAPQVKGFSVGGTGFLISAGNYGTCTTAYETILNGDTSITDVAGAPWANGYVNRPESVTGFGFYQGATASLGAISGAWIETPGRAGDVAMTLKLRGSQVSGRHVFEYRISSGTETNPENTGTNIRTGTVQAALDHFARLKLGPDAANASAHTARLVVGGNDTITSGSRTIDNASAVLGIVPQASSSLFGACVVISHPTGTGAKISALGASGQGANFTFEGSTASAQYDAFVIRGDRQALEVKTRIEYPTYTYATRPTASVQEGTRIFIMDSLATAFGAVINAGGGLNKVPAYYADGVWKIG
jgi:hypothetical protein